MRFRNHTFVSIVAGLALLILPLATFADHGKAPHCPIYENATPKVYDAGSFQHVSCACVASGACSATDFAQVALNISQIVFGAVGAVALVMFIVGGALLLVSGGNQNYIARGKLILRSSVIGLVIIFSAWLVVNGIVVALTDTTEGTIFGNEWYRLTT